MAFGPNGQKVSIAPISMMDFENNKKLCGMVYGKCTLNYEKILRRKDKDEMENLMDAYCCFLTNLTIMCSNNTSVSFIMTGMLETNPVIKVSHEYANHYLVLMYYRN